MTVLHIVLGAAVGLSLSIPAFYTEWKRRRLALEVNQLRSELKLLKVRVDHLEKLAEVSSNRINRLEYRP